MTEGNLQFIVRENPMNINLNNQYAVLRSSAYDLNQAVKVQSKSITQLAAGSLTADPTQAGAQASSVLKLRNSGLRLRALETGVVNAISYLETQAGVFQQMTSAVNRMSQLAMQMRDATKSTEDLDSYMKEMSQLQDELSSYRMSQFNGKNLMNYLSGTAQELLPVALSENGDVSLNVTQSETRDPSGAFYSFLGPITTQSTPNREAYLGVSSVSEMIGEDTWGQKGFALLIEDITQRMTVNQTEQAQLRLNLDRIRERMLGTDSATSQVADVDVAQELAAMSRTDIQLRGAIATKTQSNVLADSALKILSNQDFSSPLIQEARLSVASTLSMAG